MDVFLSQTNMPMIQNVGRPRSSPGPAQAQSKPRLDQPVRKDRRIICIKCFCGNLAYSTSTNDFQAPLPSKAITTKRNEASQVVCSPLCQHHDPIPDQQSLPQALDEAITKPIQSIVELFELFSTCSVGGSHRFSTYPTMTVTCHFDC